MDYRVGCQLAADLLGRQESEEHALGQSGTTRQGGSWERQRQVLVSSLTEMTA